jgi:hypothetical protein
MYGRNIPASKTILYSTVQGKSFMAISLQKGGNVNLSKEAPVAQEAGHRARLGSSRHGRRGLRS